MSVTFPSPGTQVLMALADHSSTKHAHADSSLALPHHVYTVAIADVREGLWRPIGPIATRILQVTGGEVTSAFEVSAGPDGTPQVSSATMEGPTLSATSELIEHAERICGNRTLVFRLLRAPFLHMFVAWLHEEGEDVFIPLRLSETAGQPQDVEFLTKGLGQGWNTDEMMEILQSMAERLEAPPPGRQAPTYRLRRGD